MLRRPEGLDRHPIVGDVVHDLSTRPDAADISLIGIGEDEFVGPDEYNQGVDARMVERAAAAIAERMPAMSEAQFMGGWSGLFTVTPDWHPVLDRVEGIDGLFCAVGFSGHGFKLSPVIGAVMSEMMLDGRGFDHRPRAGSVAATGPLRGRRAAGFPLQHERAGVVGAGLPIRNAARIVVADESDRVLLFRGCSQEWEPPRVGLVYARRRSRGW